MRFPRRLLVVAGLLPLTSFSACSEGPVAVLPNNLESWMVTPQDVLRDSVHAAGFRQPQWSPDGGQIVMLGVGGLYISDFPPTKPPTLVIPGNIYQYSWSMDGRHFAAMHYSEPLVLIYDGRLRSIVGRISIPSARFLRTLSWSTDGYLSVSAPDERKRFIYDVAGNLKAPREIEDHNYAWWLTNNPYPIEIWASNDRNPFGKLVASGDYAFVLTQSPIAGLFAFWTNTIHPGFLSVALSDYAGKVVHAFPPAFRPSDWSADGRYLVGLEEHDDGDAITASEIGVFDLRTSEYALVTNTPGVIEQAPSLSVAKGLMAYEVDGRVIIARVGKSSE